MEQQSLQPVQSCALNSANLSQKTVTPETEAKAGFVAINYIDCKPHYVERFECLFCSRARMIDNMAGFLGMRVLKCEEEGQPYLILSYWETKEHFEAWVGSPEFYEGHKRAFADLKEYKERGEEPPMKSDFKTYSIIAD